MTIKQLLNTILTGASLDESGRTQGRALLEKQFKSTVRTVAGKVQKSGDASIREILLHTCAHGTKPALGGTVGDILRDRYEARVVALAAPQVEDSTPEPQRIVIVQTALLDVLF